MTKTDNVYGSSALAEKRLRVITIEATEQPQDVYLRVAAYTRVSSASDDQLNSFGAQNRYYTEYISKNPKWRMVDIYADEGITGTSIEKREDFKRMIADCDHGLIDRILVKSISRFARNTTECLETIRKLKAKGIGIFFEKEGIDTSKVSGEMLTAVFASLAQAESESISGNMRWSYQKRMQAGTYLPASVPYGYKLRENKIVVKEAEAAIVSEIFDCYASGSSRVGIAEDLNKRGVPSPAGKKWCRSTVLYILTNERYLGDSLWQKTICTESLPHQHIRNTGQKDQYYANDTHPAIISRATFAAARRVKDQRKEQYYTIKVKETYALTGIVECAECGSKLRRKVIRDTVYWVCTEHERSLDKCKTTQVAERIILKASLRMYFKLKHFGAVLLNQMLKSLRAVRDSRMLWSSDVIELNKRISDNLSQNQMLATLKQNGLVDPDIFISKSNELTKRLCELKQQKERLLAKEDDDRIKQTRAIIDALDDGPDFIEDFDTELFGELIDRIIVESNTCLRFKLKNGLELREQIERVVR